jgi:Mn-dependent DtxR family transcriptional regulator
MNNPNFKSWKNEVGDKNANTVLAIIKEANNKKESIIATTIADAMKTTSQNVSLILNRLEKEGKIKRVKVGRVAYLFAI